MNLLQFIHMLQKVLRELDEWAQEKSRENIADGLFSLGKCQIQIIGQSALIEAKLNLNLAATADVDIHKQIDYVFRKKFEELLKAEGKFLDPVGYESWMPAETKYKSIFSGKHVDGLIAEPEYVLISKAHKAPKKNKDVLAEYLAGKPSELFYSLAEKYKISLEEFVR